MSEIIGDLIPELQIHGELSVPSILAGELAAPTSMNAELNIGGAVYVVNDYEDLIHKPQINSVELIGNKSFDDLGMAGLSNMEIEELLQ